MAYAVIWPLLVLAGTLALAGALLLARGRRCAVYRLPSRGRQPAYIGVAYNWRRRLGQHRRESSWWPYVAGPPAVVWYPDRPTALAMERRMIREQRPLFNDQHNRANPHRVAIRHTRRPAQTGAREA